MLFPCFHLEYIFDEVNEAETMVLGKGNYGNRTHGVTMVFSWFALEFEQKRGRGS